MKGGGISIVRITVLNCLAHYIKYVTIKLLMDDLEKRGDEIIKTFCNDSDKGK